MDNIKQAVNPYTVDHVLGDAWRDTFQEMVWALLCLQYAYTDDCQKEMEERSAHDSHLKRSDRELYNYADDTRNT